MTEAVSSNRIAGQYDEKSAKHSSEPTCIIAAGSEFIICCGRIRLHFQKANIDKKSASVSKG
ncbi:MAG TPA: hypothetical protein DCY17_04745 [Clostridiales bacterium]|nr:hypothetical protein [Clostridiales bacterium]